ncbi:MAG: hypothetical protein AAFN12_05530, partial [Cyanobacteria bacterium J06560_2]
PAPERPASERTTATSGTYRDYAENYPQYVGQEYIEEDYQPGAIASTDSKQSTPLPKTNWISQAIASLIEEISVLWLLFLGVFLVIVSSGVLAASQWDSFSAVGQYGILFAYTLAFWAASIWAQKKENLQSTGRMLALTTLLLIPVNFWVMDRFGVLNSLFGTVVAFVAAIALTVFPLGLSAELMPRRTNRVNLVALSWLHWGWGWAIWPVVATYIGTVSTAANLTAQDHQQTALQAGDAPEENPSEENPSEENRPNSARGLSFNVIAVALSVLILLVRSLWVAQVPPYRLGLAAGICGWLLVWLTRQKASRITWERAGFALLLLGWIVSVSQSPPLQAIAISLLAISLLWKRLTSTWQQIYLVATLGVGLQTYGLIWSIFPGTFRDRLLTWLSTWFQVGTVEAWNWAGLGLFPYLLGMLGLAAYLRRQQQSSLAQNTEALTLALGVGLTLLSIGNPFTAAISFSLSTLTLAAVLWKRQLQPEPLVALAHGAGVFAIASWIYYFAPELETAVWARILLGGAIAEFIAHLILRHPYLQLNTLWGGIGLATFSYTLLAESSNSHPFWLWLTVPIALTVIANHRRALLPHVAAGFALGAIVLQVPWLTTWPITILSLAVGTLCAALNSRILRNRYTAFFTVGLGLLLANTLVWYSLIQHLSNSLDRMLIFWVITIWSLWIIQRGLTRRSNEMALRYMRATRIWAGLLMVTFLGWASAIAAFILNTVQTDSSLLQYASYALTATFILMAALAEFIRYRPIEWRYWSLAWATEVALFMGLTLQGASLHHIGIATLALALTLLIATDIWVIKRPPYRNSWHHIPLTYGGIGLFIGHLAFQADTGLFTLAAGLILLGIGRRESRFKFLSYAGLAAFSIGAYELLIYQLSQASGGDVGDGIALLAWLALALTALYRGTKRWASSYLKLSPRAVTTITHTHWALGSILCFVATQESLSQPKGIALWTLCSLLLAGYALSIGNRRWTPETYELNHDIWTSIGLIGTLLCLTYDRYVWFPDRTGLFTWAGVIACAIGFVLYRAPWERFGWSDPWRILGLWLPMLTLSITLGAVQTPGLLIIAAFYAWMAKQTDRSRLSYLSLLLLNFCLFDFLDIRGWLTSVAVSLILGLSALYIAEVDPYFNSTDRRQQRHWLRILASGIVGITALHQTETSEPLLLFAAIALLIGTAFIFAGLIVKVRAFLYVGTATFIAQVVRVLWLFVSANSLLLWAVGIVLGLIFIWVAATFESRRSQLSTQLSSWTAALEAWD